MALINHRKVARKSRFWAVRIADSLIDQVFDNCYYQTNLRSLVLRSGPEASVRECAT